MRKPGGSGSWRSRPASLHRQTALTRRLSSSRPGLLLLVQTSSVDRGQRGACNASNATVTVRIRSLLLRLDERKSRGRGSAQCSLSSEAGASRGVGAHDRNAAEPPRSRRLARRRDSVESDRSHMGSKALARRGRAPLSPSKSDYLSRVANADGEPIMSKASAACSLMGFVLTLQRPSSASRLSARNAASAGTARSSLTMPNGRGARTRAVRASQATSSTDAHRGW